MELREHHIVQKKEDVLNKMGAYGKKYDEWLDVICSHMVAKNSKILDAGCGLGVFLHFAQKREFFISGVDMYKYNVESAKSMFGFKNIRLGNITKSIPFDERFFDCITLLDVIEHFENPVPVLENLKKYLKSDGVFFISTPNGNWAYSLRKVPLLGVRDKTPGHVNVKPINYWSEVLSSSGFEVIEERYSNHWMTHIQPIRIVNYILTKKLNMKPNNIPLLREFCGTSIICVKAR